MANTRKSPKPFLLDAGGTLLIMDATGFLRELTPEPAETKGDDPLSRIMREKERESKENGMSLLAVLSENFLEEAERRILSALRRTAKRLGERPEDFSLNSSNASRRALRILPDMFGFRYAGIVKAESIHDGRFPDGLARAWAEELGATGRVAEMRGGSDAERKEVFEAWAMDCEADAAKAPEKRGPRV